LLPFFVFSVGATTGGVAYPVVLIGSIYTSGAVGLSLLMLVCALLGAGAFGMAAFLLGLSVAVHVTLGFFGLVIVGIAATLSGSALRKDLWRARHWLAAGLAISAVSAVVHAWWFASGSVPMTADDLRKFLEAVMTY